jgi:hypothetical protein
MTRSESDITNNTTSSNSLCPLCNRQASNTNMKFHYTFDKVYRGGYYDWKTGSLSVPVCATCRKWWKLATPFIYAPIAFILLYGFYILGMNGTKGNAFFYVGSILFAFVVGVGSIGYFVKGNRIKRWMKINMPDEAKRAGFPY